MREQLGEVAGWMGKGFAYIALIATVYVVFEVYTNYRVIAQSNIVMNETITVVIVGCVSAAVLLFLIGQAFRHIFAAVPAKCQNRVQQKHRTLELTSEEGVIDIAAP